MLFGHKPEKTRTGSCSSKIASNERDEKSGIRCSLDPNHDGPHKNGNASWANIEHIQRATRMRGMAQLAERASKRRSKP